MSNCFKTTNKSRWMPKSAAAGVNVRQVGRGAIAGGDWRTRGGSPRQAFGGSEGKSGMTNIEIGIPQRRMWRMLVSWGYFVSQDAGGELVMPRDCPGFGGCKHGSPAVGTGDEGSNGSFVPGGTGAGDVGQPTVRNGGLLSVVPIGTSALRSGRRPAPQLKIPEYPEWVLGFNAETIDYE